MNNFRTKLNLPVKAYHNIDFLNSAPARNIRILSEMSEPADRLRKHRIRDLVVFFGSARTPTPLQAKNNLTLVRKKIKNLKKVPPHLKKELDQAEIQLRISKYYKDAEELAYKLSLWFKNISTSNRHFVIGSGGGPGIMEAANKGAKKAKSLSLGLNISLPMEQAPNKYIDKDLSFTFHYFFIRKFWFLYLSKCIVIFPGGFGTLDELFEALTLIQTKKTRKPIPIVLYGSEYWDEIINFSNLVKWGTVSREDLKLFKVFDDVDEALYYIKKEITRHYLKAKPFNANP
ncbi:MAG: LOG family protein [Candidatus Omnitrophica bacterium]|nr:LOG family protein [Candidatus Omnitrophota bacterium]